MREQGGFAGNKAKTKLLTTRELAQARKRNVFARGVRRRACHVLMGGGWTQDRLHPPPKKV